MSLFFSRLRKLPFSAALSVAMALAGFGAAPAWAQTSAKAPAKAAAPMGTPMGSPMGTPLGLPAGSAQQAEPLQRSVDAGRQPAGAAVGAPGNAVQSTPADGPQPLNSAATVGADYRLGPSDLLDFDIYGVPDMQRTVRVNASGVVSLPLIGPVMLAGMTTAQAEASISQKYAKDFLQNPQVSLFVKEFTSQRITIEGAVAKPGIYPVTGQLTLLRALALAGGGAQFSLLNEVMLFRSGSSLASNTEVFDLEKIRNGEVPDPTINADDVIVVKRDPKRTALRDSFFGDVLNTLNPFK